MIIGIQSILLFINAWQPVEIDDMQITSMLSAAEEGARAARIAPRPYQTYVCFRLQPAKK